MPKRLYARTHTSGRTKSVQDAPTTNDHDCTDAKANQAYTAFHGERGFRQGRRNKDTPSFKHGCLQVVEQSRCRTHRQQTTTVAQKQSQQSVLKGIGIENKHFFLKKQTFFYNLRRYGKCRAACSLSKHKKQRTPAVTPESFALGKYI